VRGVPVGTPAPSSMIPADMTARLAQAAVHSLHGSAITETWYNVVHSSSILHSKTSITWLE